MPLTPQDVEALTPLDDAETTEAMLRAALSSASATEAALRGERDEACRARDLAVDEAAAAKAALPLTADAKLLFSGTLAMERGSRALALESARADAAEKERDEALRAVLANLGPGGYLPSAGKPATDFALAVLARIRKETPDHE